ncbi:calcium/sodium antiporter [Hydrogenophaga sp.]|jgi:cation:H+ antiporter|uniref:calcium/sodium antiporter n=1 Tax=Hydrogenophaga sp. TaxID=1904254 RepID=UPI0027315944|nr:calcium/sodium antiporter [Hydrogenophaga sp.]MDP2404729.1 calcium/sodium antiporter [Hydrogenophaga sp.]MDP3323209.1 calcium/sodium antiporter [Hydrogenophaga sp.]MDP3887210.1 calcium/sodium antiporter [Hydrogenophaga sp.]MDZ4174061.1 calcium/sodium antiporter [Hydrogenophaga sp.]
MLLPSLAILAGLILLVWSADRFVAGASATAQHFSVPPLLVGMLIVGFGTSAPEMVVSVLAASQGTPGLALGNAWGSNIVNMGLILGITALIAPIMVRSVILRKELPILMAVTALSALLVWDGVLSRLDAAVLLLVFGTLVTWSIVEARSGGGDNLATETATELEAHPMPIRRALLWLGLGLLLLVGSSRLLVWGAVSIAQSLGVSDLIIGLTVVALGTSLPELASCVAAARKGEHDIALGNVLGSGLFNTLAVVGLAGVIAPMDIGGDVLSRDLPMMAGLTMLLFAMGWGFRGQGRINRLEALMLLALYAGYTAWLLASMTPGA